MSMQEGVTIFPLGDGALIVSFGNLIDNDVNQRVIQLFNRIKNSLPFIIDIVPAYSSLTIYYDVLSLRTKNKSAFEQVKEHILPFLAQTETNEIISGRDIAIPVCYAKKYAFDLDDLAAQKNLSSDEVVQLHTAKTYRIYMIGFLPGFAYMGKVDERIATPRKQAPRTTIAAGSVGIAGEQTGIYPLNSPGGWNIIGRTPLTIFDAEKTDPVLLQPGDNVTFYSITEDEFESYQGRTA